MEPIKNTYSVLSLKNVKIRTFNASLTFLFRVHYRKFNLIINMQIHYNIFLKNDSTKTSKNEFDKLRKRKIVQKENNLLLYIP